MGVQNVVKMVRSKRVHVGGDVFVKLLWGFCIPWTLSEPILPFGQCSAMVQISMYASVHILVQQNGSWIKKAFRGVCLCVSNKWAYADNCADAVDWRFNLWLKLPFDWNRIQIAVEPIWLINYTSALYVLYSPTGTLVEGNLYPVSLHKGCTEMSKRGMLDHQLDPNWSTRSSTSSVRGRGYKIGPVCVFMSVIQHSHCWPVQSTKLTFGIGFGRYYILDKFKGQGFRSKIKVARLEMCFSLVCMDYLCHDMWHHVTSQREVFQARVRTKSSQCRRARQCSGVFMCYVQGLAD